MKKFITMLVVSALLFSTEIPSMAVSTSGSGPVPQEVVVIPFDDKSGNGINYVILNPEAAPTTSTITLYDASDGSVAGAEQEIEYKTANDWAKTQFTGLDANTSYYAVIKMSNGSGEGTYITDAVTPVYKDFDGHKFGRLTGVDHLSAYSGSGYRHSLTTYHIDSTDYYEGTSSLKITAYGWDGGTSWAQGGTEDDTKYDRISFGGIKIGTPREGYYYELKTAYKGDDIIKDIKINANEISSSTETSNGWTVVTKVYQATGTAKGETEKEGVKPEIQIKLNSRNATVWIDSISVRRITDYDNGSYSDLEDNIVSGGGFDTSVKNLQIDGTTKTLSWEIPNSAMFFALNIYKDNESTPIGTSPYTLTYNTNSGVTTASYTIPTISWDENSTYSVKAITAGSSDATNSTIPTSSGQEGAAASVKGIVPQKVAVIPFQNADSSNQYGINYMILNPTTAPTTSTITLYNALDDSVAGAEKSIARVDANEWTKTQFTGLDSTTSYYAVIKMSDGTNIGTHTTEATKPGYQDFDGYKFGRLSSVKHLTVSKKYRHSLITYNIDSDEYQEGTSSLKVTTYGWDADDTWETTNESPPSPSYETISFGGIKFSDLSEEDYYEYKVAYKGSALIYGNNYEGITMAENCGMTQIGSPTSEVINGWTVVTKVMQASATTASTGIIPNINIKIKTYRTMWIDSISIRKINDYNAGSYSSLGDNIALGCGFDVAVKNLRMDSANRQLSWELPESALFYALKIYKDGTLIDTINFSGYHGVTATSYTVSVGDWDSGSTYTVKAIPTSGGKNATTNPDIASKEGPAVYVKNPSFVLSEDGDGAKATVYSADSTYSALLMCCEYLNSNFDELIQFVSVPVSIQQLNTEQEFSLTPTRTRPGSKFKAFLWEFENLTALADDLDMTNVP